jgi:hypothetical protein
MFLLMKFFNKLFTTREQDGYKYHSGRDTPDSGKLDEKITTFHIVKKKVKGKHSNTNQ